MGNNKFCKEIWSRGKEETKKYYKKDRRGWTFNIGFATISAITAPIIDCYLGATMMIDSRRAILAGLIAGVIVFILWYLGVRLYFWITSPAKTYYEHEKKIKKLEKQISIIEEPEKLKVRQQFFKVERDHFYTWIENYSNKKIVDVEAHIQIVHMITSKYEGHESRFMRQLIPPERENILDEKVIRAGNNLKICVATGVFDENQIVFSDKKLFFKDFENAVFKVFMEINGKYEGENEYKKNLFDIDIEVDLSKKYIGLAGIREFAEKLVEVFPNEKRKSK